MIRNAKNFIKCFTFDLCLLNNKYYFSALHQQYFRDQLQSINRVFGNFKNLNKEVQYHRIFKFMQNKVWSYCISITGIA